MLGAGQREIGQPKAQKPFPSSLRGGYLRPPALREAQHWLKFEVLREKYLILREQKK
jgi:hypothetical protein